MWPDFDRQTQYSPKPGSRNLSKKLMFYLLSLDVRKKTWLGDDFNQFFIEMWYSATCSAILFAASLWACSMSINAKRRLDQLVFFTVLKINDLYILPPLFGESFEVKHIPCRKKMQNTTFILALSNFHNNWICLHYSPYCVPLKTTMAFWFDKFFFWENPPCLNYMLLHNFLSSF